MKLKINVIDFEKCEISFIVPREVMENRAWGAGQAEVDIFAVSQTLEERASGSKEPASTQQTSAATRTKRRGKNEY